MLEQKPSTKTMIPKKRKPTPKKTEGIRRSAPTVSYSQSITRNLGNYESIKIQIGMELPCDGETEEDVLTTLNKAREIVAVEMHREVEAITAHTKGD